MNKFRRGKNIVLNLSANDIRTLIAGSTIKLSLKEQGLEVNVVIINGKHG